MQSFLQVLIVLNFLNQNPTGWKNVSLKFWHIIIFKNQNHSFWNRTKISETVTFTEKKQSKTDLL